MINGIVFPAPVPAITMQSRPRRIALHTSICQLYGSSPSNEPLKANKICHRQGRNPAGVCDAGCGMGDGCVGTSTRLCLKAEAPLWGLDQFVVETVYSEHRISQEMTGEARHTGGRRGEGTSHPRGGDCAVQRGEERGGLMENSEIDGGATEDLTWGYKTPQGQLYTGIRLIDERGSIG